MLGSDDLQAQTQGWTRLCRTAELSRVLTEKGVLLEFRASPDVVSELHALVAVERECCAWATWTITHTPSLVVLEVSATAAGVEALHGMFPPHSA